VKPKWISHIVPWKSGEAACSSCCLLKPGEIFLAMGFPLGSGQCLPGGGDDALKMKLFFFTLPAPSHSRHIQPFASTSAKISDIVKQRGVVLTVLFLNYKPTKTMNIFLKTLFYATKFRVVCYITINNYNSSPSFKHGRHYLSLSPMFLTNT